MKMKKLDDKSRAAALKTLKGWKESKGGEAIAKNFKFDNFNEACGCMTRVALLADKMDHHPQWFNVYNKIEVTLSTHDARGVTQNDIEMAKAMNDYAG